MKLLSTDIHCHLLPGVDDGFDTPEHSLAAIRKMRDAGCREFVFTPHMNPDVYPDSNEDTLRAAYAAFLPQIAEAFPSDFPGSAAGEGGEGLAGVGGGAGAGASGGLAVHLAAEYMVINDFERRAADPASLLTFPDGSVLIEMSYFFRSSNLESTLFELNLAGLKPILAHPERYAYMADCLKDFESWRDMGCRFQLNLMSLTGKYGPASVRIMKHLFSEGYYDFAATDLHSLAQLDALLAGKPLLSLRRPFRHWLEQR